MKNFNTILVLLALILSGLSCLAQKEILYVGTYSQRGSQGIYVYEFDRKLSSFKLLQTKPEIKDPNFLALSPGGDHLYAVNTVKGEDGKNKDVISSFTINPKNGTLAMINQMPDYGNGACHISMDNKGKWLFVSNYTSGNLAIYPVKNDGSVGDTVQFINDLGRSLNIRQKAPHVHSTLVSPDNKFVYVADLGIDKVLIYTLDQKTGKLSPAKEPSASTEPGAGPRHFTFHPKKSFFYVAQEINSTVSFFKRNESTGSLSPFQTLSTLPEGFSGRNLVADIHIDPKGKYLYITNRGHNSIAIFLIKEDGKLELLGHEPVKGDHPRNFMVDPKGEFILVANQNTDNIVMFKIDKTTGKLTYSGVTMTVPGVVCLKWVKL